MLAMIRIMPTTISSSINENPRFLFLLDILLTRGINLPASPTSV